MAPMKFSLTDMENNKTLDSWEKPLDEVYCTFGHLSQAVLDKLQLKGQAKIDVVAPLAMKAETISDNTDFPTVSGAYDFSINDKIYRVEAENLNSK